jgi:hypothetical protein
MNKSVVSLIICLFTYVSVFTFFNIKTVRLIFNNITSYWILAILLLVVHFISFYQDATRYTDSKKCLGMKCNIFSLITGLGSLVVNFYVIYKVLTRHNLSLGVKLLILIPPFLLLSFIIYNSYKSVQLIDISKYSNIKLERPVLLQRYEIRVAVYYFLMIIGSIMFFQNYIDKLPENNLFGSQLERFGGWNNSKLFFIISWIAGVGGAIIDMLSLNTIISYEPQKYNLPDSYN